MAFSLRINSQPARLSPDGSRAGETASARPAFLPILYRATSLVVLLACAILLPALSSAQDQEDTPQITPRDWKIVKKKDQGPRALGLLQLSSNGKATLIPIAIRIDGKFYDATAYKADPVPMALDSGTVYEGERTGTSVGLFTLNGALRSNAATNPHPWIGTGMWLPTGAEAPRTGIRAESVPVGIEAVDAPPRLTKGAGTPNADAKTGSASTPSTPDSSSGSNPPSQNQPKQEPPKSAPTPDAKPPENKQAPASESGERRGDEANRPRLRRGKPTEALPADKDVPGYSNPKTTGAAKSSTSTSPAAASKVVQLIPAISDAGGPDPRSYALELDKTEAEERRKQMLALAQEQILAYVAQQAKARVATLTSAPKTAAGRRQSTKPAPPELENVQLRTFDPWTNQQPVMVLTAEANVPLAPGATGSSDSSPQYRITLVARTDIYSNLHALYAGVTDKYHLDVTPRLDLIDVVDADGDGRGELLFQETTEGGSGYVIYRPTADKLWKMFDSLNPE